MVTIDANNAKPGTKLLVDGDLYTVVERAHHKPGKGGAFVKFKLKGLTSGKVIDYTVRAGTNLEQANVTTQTMQFLYQEDDHYVFMDLQTFDQVSVPKDVVGFAGNFLVENAEIQVTFFEENPIGVQLPPKMDLEVTETIDQTAKGNTATNVTKDATLETGMTVQVPPFVKTGDRVRISTEDGSYVERA